MDLVHECAIAKLVMEFWLCFSRNNFEMKSYIQILRWILLQIRDGFLGGFDNFLAGLVIEIFGYRLLWTWRWIVDM